MREQSGKVAVVTGSTRGIGRAIAQALAGLGVRVVVSGRRQEECDRVAAQLPASPASGEPAAIGIACDVRHYAPCERLIEGAVARMGRLDILINNAGIGAFAPVADMEPATWDAVIQTNLNSLFYCTHAAMPHLRAAGDAWVINIGSLAGKNAFPNGTAYNASKFGLIGFSEALMQEVRYEGIRVSYIMPGSVATEFNNRRPDDGDDWRIHPEDVARAVVDVLSYPSRSLTSRIELRPSRPRKGERARTRSGERT
jgi:NAD(P)-dependent dehydrogenase (short-subunit alcohol dehydrogenase family)